MDARNRGLRFNVALVAILLLVILSCGSKSMEDVGTMVVFDGYELYVKDHGAGVPTVIIENGLCCNTKLYDDLFNRISQYTRVLSYDHAGIGRSTCNNRPRTLDNFAYELKTLLEYKGISPPYILVGHSMGGFQIRYFAHLYPDEIAGMVFIDTPHEDWFTYIRSRHSPEELTFFNNFFDPKKRDLKEGALAELACYTIMCDSVRGKRIPRQIPVRMYTGTAVGPWAKEFGYDQEDMVMWAKMQNGILDGVDDAQHCIDKNASHFFHLNKPHKVLKGIKDLIKLYRQREMEIVH